MMWNYTRSALLVVGSGFVLSLLFSNKAWDAPGGSALGYLVIMGLIFVPGCVIADLVQRRTNRRAGPPAS